MQNGKRKPEEEIFTGGRKTETELGTGKRASPRGGNQQFTPKPEFSEGNTRPIVEAVRCPQIFQRRKSGKKKKSRLNWKKKKRPKGKI